MSHKILILFCIALLVFSCSKDDEMDNLPDNTTQNVGTNEDDNNDITTNDDFMENVDGDKTVVLTFESTNTNLIDVDSTRVVFKKGNDKIEALEVGDIIISDMTDVAPDGYLRRITEITEQGGILFMKTEQASLADAIKEDHIRHTRTISSADIINIDTSGVDITEKNGEIVFSYDKIIHDEDGNHSTKYDQIKVEGEVELRLELDFELDFDEFSLNNFKVETTFTNTYELELTGGGNIESYSTDEIVLATFQLTPFTIVSPLGIPIPIAKQWVVLVLDGSGKVKVELETSAECEFTGVNGIQYQSGTGWTEISESNSSCNYTPPTLEGEVSAQANLQFRYEVRPYGVKSSRIFVGLKGYAKAEITPELGNPVIPWQLYWGIDLLAKAQMQIFDYTVANYDNTQNIYEAIIAEGTLGSSNNKFTDPRDGEEYSTVVVDGKRWLAENLRFQGGYYSIGNVSDKCPNGWRLASKVDYENLVSFANSTWGSIKALMEINPNAIAGSGGTNESGLSLTLEGNENTFHVTPSENTSYMLNFHQYTVVLWYSDNGIISSSLLHSNEVFSFHDNLESTSSYGGYDNTNTFVSCRCIEE